MKSPVNSIIRQSTRRDEEKYNVLCCATHEGYQASMSGTNAEYYFYFTDKLKRWRHDYRALPKNCHILPDDYIPSYIDFDLCLSQSRFGQHQALKPIADKLHIPYITIEHTDRLDFWSDSDMSKLKNMKGIQNYFITDYSRSRWGWSENEAGLIPHGVDTELFKPDEYGPRHGILSVVNDFVNRGAILGFDMWKRLVKDLPTYLAGDTPPLSQAAPSVEHLVSYYQKSSIFLNTSVFSPIPTVMLEAAACECAIVSTSNCAIPEIFTHGHDALLSNNESELREYLELLLKDDELSRTLGRNARKTISEKYGLDKFTQNWDSILKHTASLTYTGV